MTVFVMPDVVDMVRGYLRIDNFSAADDSFLHRLH